MSVVEVGYGVPMAGGVMVFLRCDLWALDCRLFLIAEMEMARDCERESERSLTTKKEKLIKNGFVDEQCIKVLVEQNEITVAMLNFF